MKKRFFLIFGAILTATILSAQGIDQVNDALTETTSQIKTMFQPVKLLIYAAAAILAIVNIVKVVSAIQTGDQESTKKAGAWIGGCIFFGVAVFFTEKLFLS